jgi:hypothetical protein
MTLKPFDIGIVLCSLGIVVVSFFLAYSGAGGSGMVYARGEKGQWVFSVEASESLVVSGPLGDTLIEIGDGGARIASSPCVNQTCVSAGRLRSPGQWAACLPNRVMLYIEEGETKNNVDAAAW